MIRIKYFAYHVEVYGTSGEFLFSADNDDEAYRIINEMKD